VWIADTSADGRRSAASRTAISGEHTVSPLPGRYLVHCTILRRYAGYADLLLLIPNSHRQQPDPTKLSRLRRVCVVVRCSVGDSLESNSHRRRDADATVLSGLTWRCELSVTCAGYSMYLGRRKRNTVVYIYTEISTVFNTVRAAADFCSPNSNITRYCTLSALLHG